MTNDRSKDRLELLGGYLRGRAPSQEEEQAVLDRVWKDLPSKGDGDPGKAVRRFRPFRRTLAGGRLLWVGAAAALVLAVVLTVLLTRKVTPAFAKNVDGTLERVNERGVLPVVAGAPLAFGEVLRSRGATSAVLVLADGSEIELRSNSALALEKAEDGLRIRLDGGGILVSSAKQRTGHLYVRTKDVTVSVVGTVFLVNAEEAGSRVAVLQGEVQVRQGKTLKKLVPGDQVATNPLMESHPVVEQVAWSRSAEAHMALLLQQPRRFEFEAASVKPGESIFNRLPTRIRCRGIDGELSTNGSTSPASVDAPPVPLGRCVGDNTPIINLVSTAYGVVIQRISGLPGPIEQPTYQIDAKAEDPSKVTKDELRQMLQNLLIDRLKLKVHRESKEMDGYVLVVGKDGVKFKAAEGVEDPFQLRGQGLPQPGTIQLVTSIAKGNFSLRSLADSLSVVLRQPVVDKTSLPGIYEMSLTIHQLFTPPSGDGGGRGGPTGARVEFDPPVSKALEEQLGLRLEAAKVPVEYLVIDHIEKATEN